MRIPRTVLTPLLALGMLGTTAGIANGVASAATHKSTLPTIVIGNEGFTESYIMQDIYGDLLTKAGFKVSLLAQSGTTRQVAIPALEAGKTDIVPDYAGSLLVYLAAGDKKQAGAITTAETALNGILGKKGAEVLPGTAGLDQNVFVVTKATASKYHLTTLSSLKAHASALTLGGPAECPTNYFCEPGLKSVYGINFKSVKATDEGGPLTVAALKNGSVQVGELFSTESSISSNGFVSLTDNKNLEPADHLIPVIRKQFATTAVKNALAKVNSLLTTKVLVGLDTQASDASHPSPAGIAEAFLKAHKLS